MVPVFVHSNQPKGTLRLEGILSFTTMQGSIKNCNAGVMPLCEIFRNNVFMKNYNHYICLLKHHSKVIEEIRYFPTFLFPKFKMPEISNTPTNWRTRVNLYVKKELQSFCMVWFLVCGIICLLKAVFVFEKYE